MYRSLRKRGHNCFDDCVSVFEESWRGVWEKVISTVSLKNTIWVFLMWYIGRNTEISYTTVDVDDRDRPIIARRAMQYLVSTFRSLLHRPKGHHTMTWGTQRMKEVSSSSYLLIHFCTRYSRLKGLRAVEGGSAYIPRYLIRPSTATAMPFKDSLSGKGIRRVTTLDFSG